MRPRCEISLQSTLSCASLHFHCEQNVPALVVRRMWRTGSTQNFLTALNAVRYDSRDLDRAQNRRARA
jgi:hypothetical protein